MPLSLLSLARANPVTRFAGPNFDFGPLVLVMMLLLPGAGIATWAIWKRLGRGWQAAGLALLLVNVVFVSICVLSLLLSGDQVWIGLFLFLAIPVFLGSALTSLVLLVAPSRR